MRTPYSLSFMVAALTAGALCALIHPHLFVHWLSHLQWRVAVFAVMVGALFSGTAAKAQTLTLSTSGGITIGGAGAAFTGTFGNMNGLGAGAVPAGTTVYPMSNGTLYYSTFNMRVSALGGAGRTGWVNAYVSTNPHTAALVGYGCPYPQACTASGNYVALGTSTATATNIIASPGIANNTTVTVGVGIFLPDNDGASAYTGTSNVVITFKLTNFNTGATRNVTLTLTTTVQTAVQLKLGTATGGATIGAGGNPPDYTLSFGNVNALGIGMGAGFNTTPAAGGIIYYTPYLLNPAFSGFTSTTSTIKVSLSTNFAHPAVLTLEDSAVSGGPYTAITAAAMTITSTAADRSSITRYLGLFISNVNGATSYRGADSATLTFTFTVP